MTDDILIGYTPADMRDPRWARAYFRMAYRATRAALNNPGMTITAPTGPSDAARFSQAAWLACGGTIGHPIPPGQWPRPWL